MSKSHGAAASKRIFWKLSLALGCLTAISFAVVACSSGSGTSTGSGMGKVNVMVSDPATCQAPTGPFAQVWVTITEVDINESATATPSDSGWTDMKLKTPMPVNLLGLPNKGCFLANLGDTLELQAGTYQQIRLKLAPNSGTVYTSKCNGANNCVVLDDNSVHTLNLSSEAQTGIKIPAANIASGGFTVQGNKTEDLDINFLTCESIVHEGNGQYRLKPVLRAGEVSATSNSINGTVLDASTDKPIDGIVTVSLEQMGPNNIDQVVMSQKANSDGTWVICPVTMGNTSEPYDVVITAENSDGTMMYAPTIITGVTVGSTTNTVKLNAAPTAPASYSVATLKGAVNSVDSSNNGVSIDVLTSVLEQVNSTWYTIPVSIPQTSGDAEIKSADLLTTAKSSTQTPCDPTSAYCADYSYDVPSVGAYIGAWSSSNITVSEPNPLATYEVDGIATNVTTGATDCSTSELQTTPPTALATPGPFSETMPTLKFQSCTGPTT